MDIVVLRAGDPVAEVAARRGEFADWIRAIAAVAWAGGWRTHELRNGDPLPAIDSAAAFVVTGSSSSVTERAPWILRAEEFIRAIVAADKPLLGICFGHQMMAQALGGQVTKNPRGREIGTVRIERLEDDPLFRGLPSPFEANQTHVDSVARLPKGARVLASTSLDPLAAFAVGGTSRAVQFHPEIDADVMRGYVQARAGVMREEGLDVDAILAAVHETPHGHEVIRNFVREIVLRDRRHG
jgi:GMP synthase (glutamine-hydrolysing)